MTEAEWLAATDPTPMLEFLREKSSDRKLRLFGVACCRRLWHLMDETHCAALVEFGARSGRTELGGLPLDSARRAVELAEQRADKAVRKEALKAASEAAFALSQAASDYSACYDEGWGQFDSRLMASGSAACGAHCASLPYLNPVAVVLQTSRAAAYIQSTEYGEADQNGDSTERTAQCVLIRDIFNPFRPIGFSPAWRTSTVLALAEGIYADRAFDRLPILADALMDAGCDAADILAHCRGDGPHVRGCWVVDLVLGKE